MLFLSPFLFPEHPRGIIVGEIPSILHPTIRCVQSWSIIHGMFVIGIFSPPASLLLEVLIDLLIPKPVLLAEYKRLF